MNVDYRTAVKAALRPFSSYTSLDLHTETVTMFDDATANYAVVQLGWEDGDRILLPLVHIRIRDEKVVVEINATDAEIDDLLLQAGIPYSALVLDQEEPASPA
jgi:hypothetical protein